MKAQRNDQRGRGRRFPARNRPAACRHRRLLAEPLESRTLLALTPQLLADINSTQLAARSLGPTVEVGGLAYFASSDPVRGIELWKSDGTVTGTTLVKDINAGPGSSSPQSLTNVNGTLFFGAGDGAKGYELWKSDGTAAGTVLVKDILTGGTGSYPRSLVNANGVLFFQANDGANGIELWKSDGTTAGTVVVKDIHSGLGGSDPSLLANVNGTLFFRARDGSSNYELWRSDGTAGGTVLVSDIWPGASGSFPGPFTNVNGTLFFVASDGVSGDEIWKSDGTAAGTVLLKDIRSGSSTASPRYLTNLNGSLLFSANDGVNSDALWRSDGTAAGTAMLKAIRPGATGAYVSGVFANLNGTLLFTANDGANGPELWKSDGTATGTILVKEIRPGASGSNPTYALAINGSLFFSANDGASGRDLWKSDGTTAGTVLVKDIYSASSSFYLLHFSNINGTLFFSTNEGPLRPPGSYISTGELWKSDGTPAGTVVVPVGGNSTESSSPGNITIVNGTAFFSANDGKNGSELWKTDGTATGTVLVKDINPGPGSSIPAFFANLNGLLIFRVEVGGQKQLWRSNGTGAGTMALKDLDALLPVANLNGTLLLVAIDAAHGGNTNRAYLWKTDGTPEGTVLVKSVRVRGNGGEPAYFATVNQTLFFAGESDDGRGFELWKSDGTAAGTELVKEIDPVTLWGGPQFLANLNGKLFFSVSDGAKGQELWTSDGTAAGTVLFKEIKVGSDGSYPSHLTNLNGTLYFAAADGVHGWELWKNDGTIAGTVLVQDLRPGAASSYLNNLRDVSGTLLFTASTRVASEYPWEYVELWKSDGTVAGTVLLRDFGRRSFGSHPINSINFTNANGALLFSANDGTSGYELWRSDGTSIGTILAKDIAPGPRSSEPSGFQVLSGRILFSADDGVHGRELWSAENVQSNQPPVVNNDPPSGFLTTPEETSISGNVLTNDTDPNGDTLRALLVSPPSPFHGIATLSPNGNFTFTPAPNFNGPVTFTYKANDGQLDSNTATVAITVTPVPIAIYAVNDHFRMGEDATLSVSVAGPLGKGVLANDDDVDGPALSATQVGPRQLGLLTLNTDGSFFYAPPDNFSGVDSFTYRASDGEFSRSTGTVFITVEAVNDPPVANNDSYPLAGRPPLLEDGSLNVTGADGALRNDSDPDSPALFATLVTGPANAAVGGFTFNPNGSFTYVPRANFNGTDSFTYRVSDGQIAAVGTVTLSVTAVNDPPSAVNDNYTTAFNTSLNVSLGFGVMNNDIDEDAPKSSLIATKLSNPTNGIVTLNPNGTFVYTPTSGFAGLNTFTYAVSDGVNGRSGTVTINVLPAPGVNSAPTASDNAFTTAEDVPATGNVLGGDTDPNNDTLAAVLVSSVAQGQGLLSLDSNGTFTYMPATDFNSGAPPTNIVSFRYRVHDGQLFSGNTATVRITVTPVNDPPVAKDDVYLLSSAASTVLVRNAALGVLRNDTDIDSSSLTASLVTGPASAAGFSFNPDGSFSYRLDTSVTDRMDRFSYAVSDGQYSSTAMVTISTDACLAPSVDADDSYTVRDDTLLDVAAPGVLANSDDPAGEYLIASVVTNPTNGALILNANGSFRYTPATYFHGLDSFTYSNGGPNDGCSGRTATVTITVEFVNDAPTFDLAGDQAVTDEQALTGVIVNDFATNMSVGPANEAGQFLMGFTVTSSNSSLFFVQPSLDSTGRLTFAPAPNAVGTATVTVQLRDSGGRANGGNDTGTRTFQVTVTKPHPWHNTRNPRDVNDSRGTTPVSALDAILIFNALNAFPGTLPPGAVNDNGNFRVPSTAPLPRGPNLASVPFFYDVNGDNFVSAIDAILVINYLYSNSSQGEGESVARVGEFNQHTPAAELDSGENLSEIIALLALDAAEQSQRKRRRG